MAGDQPATTQLGTKLSKQTQKLARSVRIPGGWGAEESGKRSEPGLEATRVCRNPAWQVVGRNGAAL